MNRHRGEGVRLFAIVALAALMLALALYQGERQLMHRISHALQTQPWEQQP